MDVPAHRELTKSTPGSHFRHTFPARQKIVGEQQVHLASTAFSTKVFGFRSLSRLACRLNGRGALFARDCCPARRQNDAWGNPVVCPEWRILCLRNYAFGP